MTGVTQMLVYLLEDCDEDQYIFHKTIMCDDKNLFSVSAYNELNSLQKAIEACVPDIVVTDLNLLESSGLDTLLKVQKLAPKSAIVVLTGSDDEDALKAIQLGAQDYLLKSELTPSLVRRTLLFAKERFQMNAALKEHSLRDQLTTLYNRSAFDNFLQNKILEYQRYHECFGLVFADINEFKAINDNHGHIAGDKILKLVADRLSFFNRASDHVARVGGDEFVVVLQKVSTRFELNQFVDSKRQQLNGTYTIKNARGEIVNLEVSLSFGAAIWGIDNVKNAQELYALADERMYKHKNSN